MSIMMKFERGEIKLPSTADEWELYSQDLGSELVAREMTNALKQAIQYVEKNLGKTRDRELLAKVMREAYVKFLDPAEDKFSRYGASDSEPRFVGRNFLLRGASIVFWGEPGKLREDGWDTDSF